MTGTTTMQVCGDLAASCWGRKRSKKGVFLLRSARLLAGAPRTATSWRPAALSFRRVDAEFGCSHGEQVDEGMAVLWWRIHETALAAAEAENGHHSWAPEPPPVEESREGDAWAWVEEMEAERRRGQRQRALPTAARHVWLAAAALVLGVPTAAVLGATHLLLALRALRQGMLRK